MSEKLNILSHVKPPDQIWFVNVSVWDLETLGWHRQQGDEATSILEGPYGSVYEGLTICDPGPQNQSEVVYL